mmetsp:Transcript_35565/g.102450  ORF Transcript_35565/g.102450 Transcript_35565/m.102450 type:complete len:217 (+) Transcript_35565:588-1238(+)
MRLVPLRGLVAQALEGAEAALRRRDRALDLGLRHILCRLAAADELLRIVEQPPERSSLRLGVEVGVKKRHQRLRRRAALGALLPTSPPCARGIERCPERRRDEHGGRNHEDGICPDAQAQHHVPGLTQDLVAARLVLQQLHRGARCRRAPRGEWGARLGNACLARCRKRSSARPSAAQTELLLEQLLQVCRQHAHRRLGLGLDEECEVQGLEKREL